MTTLTKPARLQTRWTQHLTSDGVSVSVDVSNPTTARVTLAVCNPKDRYSRKAARFFLDLRFDGSEAVLNSLNMKRNVFSFPYSRGLPKRDILIPLVDLIRKHLGYFFHYESKRWLLTNEKGRVRAGTLPRVDQLVRLVRNFTQSRNFFTDNNGNIALVSGVRQSADSFAGGLTADRLQALADSKYALAANVDDGDIKYFEEKVQILSDGLRTAMKRLNLLKDAKKVQKSNTTPVIV